jgi:hypothetical protein
MTSLSKLNRHPHLRMTLLIALGLALSITAGAVLISSATPAEASVAPEGPSNDTCLACHAQVGMTTSLPSGELLPLSINSSDFKQGVHGSNDVACVQCHTDITGFPHPAKTATTLREFSLQHYTTCKQCHETQFNPTLDSVHQRALAAGNTNAAICTDCHNPHYQKRITDKNTGKLLPEARINIPQTCARCHSAIYNVYKDSVHGAALIEGNPDVPTCIDCHGVHNIPDPTTAAFRLKSPIEMCGKCHTNPQIMDKYGISTNVLNTYVADFHGTTVLLFEKTSPDQETNKPVCFDCHGVHDIKRVDDPQGGLAIKQNILVKCERCHGKNIPTGFTDAWLGHYIPDANKYPLVYYVNLFYKIFIPVVLGGMGIFVITDAVRRIIDRRKKGASHA